MKKIISILLSVVIIATLAACDETKAEIALSDYIISSGTYANGDIYIADIPFINYSISVPNDWRVEKGGYWEDETYYTFHKDNTINLYAGESYLMDYIGETSLSPEYNEISALEFNGYNVKLMIIEYNDGFRYFFYIPVDESYCRITGFSPEYSQEQQEEFFNIVKTFKIVERLEPIDTYSRSEDDLADLIASFIGINGIDENTQWQEILVFIAVMSGITDETWDDPNTIDPDRFILFYEYMSSSALRGHYERIWDEDLEKVIPRVFNVELETLRKSSYYDPDSGTYQRIEGLGGATNCRIVGFEGIGDNMTLHYEVYQDAEYQYSGVLRTFTEISTYYLSNTVN